MFNCTPVDHPKCCMLNVAYDTVVVINDFDARSHNICIVQLETHQSSSKALVLIDI